MTAIDLGQVVGNSSSAGGLKIIHPFNEDGASISISFASGSSTVEFTSETLGMDLDLLKKTLFIQGTAYSSQAGGGYPIFLFPERMDAQSGEWGNNLSWAGTCSFCDTSNTMNRYLAPIKLGVMPTTTDDPSPSIKSAWFTLTDLYNNGGFNYGPNPNTIDSIEAITFFVFE